MVAGRLSRLEAAPTTKHSFSHLHIPVCLAEICEWPDRYSIRQSGGMKVRAVLRMLRQDGWEEIARRGSRRQLKHPSKRGRVTVPGKPSDDLAPGTLGSILKQAGLKNE